ncbi:angiopoietin-1 receptor-like [Watersipora subatra]|uniref:angiopoietin-1 receptor-like n=1 Tax=Watersipora subatra TaxID=2589382 RepID=UPI00355C8AA9
MADIANGIQVTHYFTVQLLGISNSRVVFPEIRASASLHLPTPPESVDWLTYEFAHVSLPASHHSRLVGEPINRLVGEPINRLVGEPINRLENEPINRLESEPINRLAVKGQSYIKGPIDVARCRASCIDKLLPLVTITDSSCSNNPDCNMCWQTCEYLFENYFLWVDMCNDYIICLPGCRQACNYWSSAKSPGLPGELPMRITVQAVADMVFFQWTHAASPGFRVVYVLRAFNPDRAEWLVLAQTVDDSCTIKKHYIDEAFRYQLLAVTQTKVLSLDEIDIDFAAASSSNETAKSNITLVHTPKSDAATHPGSTDTSSLPSAATNLIYSLLGLLSIVGPGLVIYFLIWKRRRSVHASTSRGSTSQKSRSVTQSINSASDFTVDRKSIVFGENIATENSGYTVTKGYFRSQPVYTKCLITNTMPVAASQEMLIELAKFSHLGQHSHFLSIAAVVKEPDFIVLAIERMLQHTTLTHYLRTCYKEGEIIEGALHAHISFGTARLKTELTSEDMLNMVLKLALTMDSLSQLGYLHKCLTADHVIIDPSSKRFKVIDPDIARGVLCQDLVCKPQFFMAVEVLKGEGFTARSDVWSFGMLVWQILMFGAVPLERFNDQELYMWLCSAYRPPSPPSCSSQLYELMLSCWTVYPEQRPSFSQIADELQAMLSEETLHYRLICLREGFRYSQQHSSLSAMESPAWSSPAILRQPPLLATARAFLPSNPRLNAISEANNFLSADNQPGDDEVFDCVGVESPEEVSLLQQDGQSLVRKKSYHSRQGSRRQKTSSVED